MFRTNLLSMGVVVDPPRFVSLEPKGETSMTDHEKFLEVVEAFVKLHNIAEDALTWCSERDKYFLYKERIQELRKEVNDLVERRN